MRAPLERFPVQRNGVANKQKSDLILGRIFDGVARGN